MFERLQQWAREVGDRDPYANVAQLKSLREQITKSTDAAQQLDLQYGLAEQFLNLGQPDECLTVISNILRSPWRGHTWIAPSARREIRLLEGLAYLRVGEQENCLQHHNADSCLVPIRSAGRHQAQRGATNAEAIFLELARQKTNDLGSRWLLNIAAMTLGKYPQDIPPALRIPVSVFESDFPLQRFPEIAAQAGVAIDDVAGGTIAEDFDGDGLVDVFFTSWAPLTQCHYFKNLGNGHFAERTAQSGLIGVTGGLNIMQADYNNDGWPDIYIVRGAWLGELGLLPDSLLRNNGDGTFSDVTEEAGLLSFDPALSAVWFDANNDGWIDLFVANETRDGRHPHPCQLFLNDGHGKFRECALPAGAAVQGFVRAVTAGDFDNDGWPDLYISCLTSDNILLHNDGRSSTNQAPGIHFTDVTAKARVAEPRQSFPAWFWDYDNDGWLDIFVCGYGIGGETYSTSANAGHGILNEFVADKLGLPSKGERPRLYHNNHDGTFSDVTHAARLDHVYLAMGSNFGDLDNDGWLDFYLGTGTPYFGSLVPNEMFRNNGGRSFQNVTSAGGFGHLQKCHGIAFADLNNDGQQDVVLNVGGAFAGDNYFDALFANPGHTNHWLSLKLTGKTSNRSAIGTRIKVVVKSQERFREIHRVVGSGGSFGSSPLRQEIGLGLANTIDRVEVWWPATGQTNILRGLEMDRFYEFTESQKTAQPLSPPHFAWSALEAEAGHNHTTHPN